jgi:hypothetical protein
MFMKLSKCGKATTMRQPKVNGSTLLPLLLPQLRLPLLRLQLLLLLLLRTIAYPPVVTPASSRRGASML